MGKSDSTGMAETSLLRLSPIGVSSLLTPLLSRVINHYSLNEGHRLDFVFLMGFKPGGRQALMSFSVLDSSLILFLVGFIVECWSFQNISSEHPRVTVGETSIFHG